MKDNSCFSTEETQESTRKTHQKTAVKGGRWRARQVATELHMLNLRIIYYVHSTQTINMKDSSCFSTEETQESTNGRSLPPIYKTIYKRPITAKTI